MINKGRILAIIAIVVYLCVYIFVFILMQFFSPPFAEKYCSSFIGETGAK
jgi:hypothetical protein